MKVLGIEVSKNENGLYRLNDLHKAAGGERRHQVYEWLRLGNTKEEIAYLQQISTTGITVVDNKQEVIEVKAGSPEFGGGTFVCKELVYSYAAWVSFRFKHDVWNAFDSLVNATSILELSQVQDKAIEALEAKTAYLSGQLQVMNKRRPDNENTLINIIGGSPNTIRLAYMKLVDEGELECVDSIKIEKRYFPTQNSKYVVGQKGSTLLFSDEVKSFVSGQIELDLL
jgi:hypothetical protein